MLKLLQCHESQEYQKMSDIESSNYLWVIYACFGVVLLMCSFSESGTIFEQQTIIYFSCFYENRVLSREIATSLQVKSSPK